jgi:antitoxin component of RelBE/YafQ-DinJ toxin-antitoxin module
MNKEARLEIRLSRTLKDRFLDVCKRDRLSPSDILRRCMQNIISKDETTELNKQQSLEL